MEKPWLAEYPMSLEKAEFLIHTQFPEIDIHYSRLLGEGFDNTVIQVNEEYAFRFPRRDLAMSLMEVENKILPIIAGRLPLSIPEPLFFGKLSEAFPYAFTGYKMLRGKTPYRESIEKKMISARKFACFLKELHQSSVVEATLFGVTLDCKRRLDISLWKSELIDNAKLAESLGYHQQAKLVLAYTESVKPLASTGQVSLVHGDIHIRNVLLSEKDILSGIIDWGDVHLGHRAIDISFIYSYFPKHARQAFFEIYGAIDCETEKLARFRAVFMLVRLFVYAIDRKDEPLIELIKEGLKLAIED
jgi:aminoglycoside phosphotransferase (APT) family kinase protein